VRSFSDEELERMKAQGEPGRTSFGEETVKSHGDT
jgi:hypothetical protein